MLFLQAIFGLIVLYSYGYNKIFYTYKLIIYEKSTVT